MARTLLPVVGGVLGGMIGGPMGARIGFAAGSIIGSIVDPVQVRGPSIGETGAQTSAEGAPRAIVYGTAPVTGNVISCGELVRRWVKQRGGGKGAPKVKTEHVYRTFAIRVCEGPIAGVLRVWEDDKLVYDVRPESPILAESQAWIANKTIYLGDEDQLPDPVLQAQVSGAEDTPAYRGTAYIVVDSEDLTERRGSIPQYRFEVASGGPKANTTIAIGVRSIDSNKRFFLSVDGAAFDEQEAADNYYDRLIAAANGRAVNYTNGLSQYRDAGSPVWTASVGGGWPGGKGVSFGETVILPSGNDDVVCNRSTDNGATFAAVPGEYRLSYFAHRNGIVVGARTRIYRSSSGGASFGSGFATIAGSSADMGECLAASASLFLYGARKTTGEPMIWTSPDGISWSEVTLPFARAALVDEIVAGVIGGAEIIVASGSVPDHISPNGDLWYSLDGGASWALSDSVIPNIKRIVFNGRRFIALQIQNKTPYAIFTSDDGKSWVERPQSPEAGMSSLADLAALRGGVAATGALLSEIVEDLCSRATMGATTFDTSDLNDDEVAGLVLAGDYTAADAIDVLRRVYFFDRAEYDGKIHFPKRGAAVAEVLTVDDLVEDPESSTREQASEYPAKLHLFYQHAASGYARVKSTAQRSSPDARVVGEISIEVPVVLGEDEAAQIAHKMHKVSWADAEGEVKVALPESFIGLVAADCIGLSLRDRVRRLRIEEMQLADGRLQLTTRVDRQSAYTSAITGIPMPAPTPPPGTIVGAAVLAVLDIPVRRDAEDDLNLYYAVSAVEPAWYGALVERSMDGGATWSDAAQVDRAMRIGVLTVDLSDASEHYTDTTNRVRVRMYRQSQELESITEQLFLSGGGAFAVQSPGGGWEVLQYLDADDLGDQEYELSMLHRGRLATEPTAHLTGALVVFLDDVEHVAAQSAWIGQSLTHRATSFGETSESAATQAMTYEGRSQLEWPVAYLALDRDGLDVISGAWTPRHRFGSDDAPVASINFEGYRVTIDDGSTQVVIDTDQPHFTYDASALAAPVTVSVAARNRITGAGPATSDSV